MSAIDAEIEGVIYATKGRIGCTSKYSSDGWIIETNRLYSGSGSTRVELNSNSEETYAIWAGAASSVIAASNKFAVSKTGALYAKEGNIGGWTLKSRSFSNSTNTIGMASSGTYTFWSGASSSTSGSTPKFNSSSYFYVTSSGQMSCRGAEIRGDLYADYLECDNGKIGGWTITSSQLSAGGTRLVNDGNIYTTYGKVGMVTGKDDDGTTYNFGLQATGGNGSIILQATEGNGNIALRATNYIFLQANKLSCGVSAANQTGIYARFA